MADRPLLVFAHAFGGSARSWAPILAALGDRFDCLAPDLPGFGGSPPPVGVPGLDGYIEEFAALAADRRWIAVGHSMGGKMALGAAACSPTLSGLILIAPSPPTPEPMTDDVRQKTLDAFRDRPYAEETVRKGSGASLTPAIFAEAVEDQISVDAAVWRWWLERGSRDDISGRMSRITAPSLVLYGDADQVLGQDVPRGVAARIRNSHARSIAGGGHLLPLEQPAAVAEHMARFIAGV